MNYNQNQKIAQITPSTLIVGIDIAKDKHVARFQDDRGMEFGKRVFFDNRIHGFELLLERVAHIQKDEGKTNVIFGVEPTGHYWTSLAYFLTARGYEFVLVNPMHVKKSKQLMIIDGRVQINLQRYFPEFQDVFKDWSGKAALCTLRTFPFPSDIREMSPEEVLAQWKTVIKGGVGIKRAITLVEKANKSIGVDVGVRFARQELHNLLDEYELYQKQLTTLDQEIEELLIDLPGAEEMTVIKGIGPITVATFYAEIGDIRNYTHPQQLVNMAGLSLQEHSSGKYKGQTRITKRGRRRLRRAIYLAVRPLVANNPTFKALHTYYTKRPDRPLKKQQSLIALCGKLLRVLFAIGKKQCAFDGNKLLKGIPQQEFLQETA